MELRGNFIRTGIKIRMKNQEGELWIRIRKRDSKVSYECYLYVGFGRRLIPISCTDVESEYAIDIEKIVRRFTNPEETKRLGKA